MPFSGSQVIADLYARVDTNLFRSTVQRVSGSIGVEMDDELLDRICDPPIVIRLVKWNQTEGRLQELDVDNEKAQSLRRLIYAQHMLNDLPIPGRFDADAVFPAQVSQIAEFGGQGLFEYGLAQFAALRALCDTVSSWASNTGQRFALLESPLGNIVPVTVLSRLMANNGVDATVLTLSLPRDTLAIPYRNAITNVIQFAADQQRRIIYTDDVLTGTRFLKTLSALKAEAARVGASSPIAIAQAFKTHWELSDLQRARRDEVRGLLQAQPESDQVPTWVEMPKLPTIPLAAGPCTYESPVIWGENDLVAGLRRVNLVFNLIEDFVAGLRKLISDDGELRAQLKELWSRDTSGVVYETTEEGIIGGLQEGSRALNWKRIRDAARARFPDDYHGAFEVEPTAGFAETRVQWLLSEIPQSVPAENRKRAEMVANALRALFVARRLPRKEPKSRGFSYCFYKYNPAYRRLHERVVEGTLEL